MNRFIVFALGLVLLAACGPKEESCPEGSIFSAAVVHPDSIQSIDPLGNLNPPGHSFPSDHMGIYLAPDEHDVPMLVNVYCPGDLRLGRARAVEHVVEGIIDFAFDLEACEDMVLIIGHVSGLDEDLFAGYTDLDTWHFDEEYSTGGETYRVSSIHPDWEIAAGTRLGWAGGNPGQGGLDYGFYDRTRPPATSAHPARWGDYGYLLAFSPLEYYPEGELRDQLSALVYREYIPGDEYPYGRVMQDVPGTAHGCWFFPGAPFPPEDAHMALVQWNSHPSLESFSVGDSVSSLDHGIYPFPPASSGRLNRHFAQVTPDGLIYGYHVGPDMTPAGWVGTILIQLPDEDTVWIEGIEGTIEDPDDWAFTGAKTVFER